MTEITAASEFTYKWAVETVLNHFKSMESTGATTRDRRYAIDILGKCVEVQNSRTDGGAEGRAGFKNGDPDVPVALGASPPHPATIATSVHSAAGIKPGPSDQLTKTPSADHDDGNLPDDPDMPSLRLCSFNYLADELRRRGATVTPAPHGGDFANG